VKNSKDTRDKSAEYYINHCRQLFPWTEHPKLQNEKI